MRLARGLGVAAIIVSLATASCGGELFVDGRGGGGGIEVAMTVPLFLTSGADDIAVNDEPPVLKVDDRGELVENGTQTLPVLIHVPRSVLTAEPHGLLQNGHGLRAVPSLLPISARIEY